MRSELQPRGELSRTQTQVPYRAARIPDAPRPIQQVHKPRAPRATRRRGPLGGVVKRAFDIVVSALLLSVLSPFLLLVWCLVRVGSPGPGIFRQPRGGMLGKPFDIYKFRTMAVCEVDEIKQAERSDPRVTRLGKLLRKSSIDELPQLVNVLKGDMSLVGPRPHALAHDEAFKKIDIRYSWRQRARPGITGLAQVSGSRGPTETDDKVRKRVDFDVEYIVSWSAWLDLKIMVRTVACALKFKETF